MRLFVAVTLSESLRRAVWRDTAALREADLPVRWVKPDGYHVTLKFLGEVGAQREAELGTTVLDAARRHRRFGLALTRLGVFPDLRRPRVIWAGLGTDPAFTSLQRDVEDGLAGLGFDREERPFHAHVTLGRAKRGARPDAFGALESLLEGSRVTGEFSVDHVELMESRLGPDGAAYRSVRRFPLEEA